MGFGSAYRAHRPRLEAQPACGPDARRRRLLTTTEVTPEVVDRRNYVLAQILGKLRAQPTAKEPNATAKSDG